MARVDNPIVGLSEEDARRLHHSYDDALVVSILGDYNTHQVLVSVALVREEERVQKPVYYTS